MELILTSEDQLYICFYDIEDHKLISRYNWKYHQGYARCGKILMHRLILGITDPRILADHKDHNGLNNRRSNLRTCTAAQNSRNSRKFIGFSKLKGVYRDLNKWHVQIMINNKKVNLGRYRSEITAGKIYDKYARESFGEFANPNFKEPLKVPAQLKMNI